MKKIAIVGGINIDIEGSPSKKLIYQDSNIGRVNISFGGVGRNIAENLARLGESVSMLSMIGNDSMGNSAKEHLKSLGVDVSKVFVREDYSSSTYLSVLNDKGDMEVGINDMAIVDLIDRKLLGENSDFLKSFDIVALDGNLMEDTLDFATELLKEKKLFYDPVSASKAVRAKDFIGRFYAIKPNVMEASILSGIEIKNEEDVKRAGEKFLSLGVKMVFITLNKDGVFYMNNETSGFLRPGKDINLVSATGCGDSFSASILYGLSHELDIKEIAKMGMAASSITMESKSAVNSNMSLGFIKRRING